MAACTCVLAAIACSSTRTLEPTPEPDTSRGTPPSAAASPTAQHSVRAGTVGLGDPVETSSLGRGTRNIQVVGSSTYWITDDRTAQHSLIVAWEQGVNARIMFTPLRAGALFQALAVSPDWLAWVEHINTQTFQDARIYAAPRGGGERILVDDMAQHGDLVTFPELALAGADLYWTVPQTNGGKWIGLLRHKKLGSGASETVETGDDSIFSWPSAAGGTLAYEIARRTDQTGSVRYRIDGRAIDVPAPSSEPNVGEGYLLVKHADRYGTGNLAVARTDDGRLTEIGPGEAPRATGALAVWSNPGALGGALARPGELCVAQVLNTRMVDNVSEFGLALGVDRLAWVRMAQTGSVISEVVRTATLKSLSC